MGTLLDDPVQFLKGVGPARAADFRKLGVFTVRDLLFTFPRALSDRSTFTTIADAEPGTEVALIVRPIDAQQKKVRGGRLRLTVVRLTDDTGEMEAVWFNSPWVLDKFQGGQVMLHGKVKLDHGMLKMEHPQFELMGEEDGEPGLSIGRIVPMYPCTGKLSQTVWRKVMRIAIDSRLPELEELYPEAFRTSRELMARAEAVSAMHFPPDEETRQRAQARLIYDECLFMQVAILLKRRHAVSDLPGRSFRTGPEVDQRIRRLFPFRLTGAQDRAIAEIVADMERDLPMHRLLQGDVGSGKTVVALYAILVAVTNNAQVCIMAPTTLLAEQHQRTITGFLANSKKASVRVGLLAGGQKKAQRCALLAELAAGTLDILVATHAALQDDVVFRDLGLVVIDEQHKFGVMQREVLLGKGVRPDTLVMTATPIPRSLALTVYGDLDVSSIDELPPGRKPVKTSITGKAKAQDLWAFVRRELAKGRQAYVVSPLVDEGETPELQSATEAFEELSQGDLGDYRLALLHGRMKREEQAEVMQRFRSGTVDALVSTIVIEVGVDIANATIMVVLHAERFGLAQLHQLRGRIGRGTEQGHFVLMTDSASPVSQQRLAVLEATSDGFKVAEEDLRLRGPGEFLGTRQHGIPDLKLVDLVRDIHTIRLARSDADAILKADPTLTSPPHRPLLVQLRQMLGDRWSEAGMG